MHRFLATWGYAGLSGNAPGTAGSAVAAMMAYVIVQLPQGWLLLCALACTVSVVGVVVSSRYMQQMGTDHDPKEIVIDEVSGQWLTYMVFYFWLALMLDGRAIEPTMLNSIAQEPLWLVVGFVLFRVFDIAKPWPISWADKRIKGGLGVMFDDWLAALAAGTLLFVLFVVWPILTGDMVVPHVPR